jgi:hypothetical protein
VVLDGMAYTELRLLTKTLTFREYKNHLQVVYKRFRIFQLGGFLGVKMVYLDFAVKNCASMQLFPRILAPMLAL